MTIRGGLVGSLRGGQQPASLGTSGDIVVEPAFRDRAGPQAVVIMREGSR